MPYDGSHSHKLINDDLRDLHILEAVAAHLRHPDSWCRGQFTVGESHCAMGWLRECAGERMLANSIATRHLVPLLPMHRHELRSVARVFVYNDGHDRTAVLSLFEQAIARLKASTLRRH